MLTPPDTIASATHVLRPSITRPVAPPMQICGSCSSVLYLCAASSADLATRSLSTIFISMRSSTWRRRLWVLPRCRSGFCAPHSGHDASAMLYITPQSGQGSERSLLAFFGGDVSDQTTLSSGIPCSNTSPTMSMIFATLPCAGRSTRPTHWRYRTKLAV